VSKGGLACEIGKNIAAGSQVEIDINTVSPHYDGCAEVVWCKPLDNHYMVGMQFIDNEDTYKSRMVQQGCQIEHYKNMIFEREGRLLDTDEAAAEWIKKFASEF
jgi:hypothetical protein